MSNARKSGVSRASRYRGSYLKSRQWFARRDRFFRDRPSAACVVCGRVSHKPSRDFELHHLSYERVKEVDGVWVANEDDGDLVPMHPVCHEAVHRVIDMDQLLKGKLISRVEATHRAIRVVRRNFIRAML